MDVIAVVDARGRARRRLPAWLSDGCRPLPSRGRPCSLRLAGVTRREVTAVKAMCTEVGQSTARTQACAPSGHCGRLARSPRNIRVRLAADVLPNRRAATAMIYAGWPPDRLGVEPLTGKPWPPGQPGQRGWRARADTGTSSRSRLPPQMGKSPRCCLCLSRPDPRCVRPGARHDPSSNPKL